MDCKKNTWLVGVIFAEKIDGNKLQWKWNPKKEYAECYEVEGNVQRVKTCDCSYWRSRSGKTYGICQEL